MDMISYYKPRCVDIIQYVSHIGPYRTMYDNEVHGEIILPGQTLKVALDNRAL